VCGIAGVIDLAGRAEPELAERMGDAIAHRGPDDRGAYSDEAAALVHLRLSIIDLSPNGHQPLADPTGRYHLVFNGEIYNYIELRRELEAKGHKFRTATDNEVLLTAFVEWGEGCERRLRGMWAFAVWDAQERTLTCSRDRFGIKPFYYRVRGRRLEFASELKAMLVASGEEHRLNERVAHDYLLYGRMEHGSETFVEGVSRLMPAHTLRFDERGLRLTRYWQLEQRESPSGDAAEAVRAGFMEAMGLHLRSDVPIGTCLSGGLDSSAIVCVVPLLLGAGDLSEVVGARQRTFTATFPGEPIDERRYAEAVVEAVGAEPHWVTFSAEDVVADLPRIVWDQDEPFGSTSHVAQWYVMKAAREAGVKVMLDGQGGDEVFAGYHTSFAPRLRDLLSAGRLGELRRVATSMRLEHGYPLSAAARSLVAGFSGERMIDAMRARSSGASRLAGPRLKEPGRVDLEPDPPPPGSDALRRHLHALLVRTQLPELLRYEDRNSMAHGIEARVPMLDHELVQLAFSLQGDELLDGATTKVVLRRALADVLPPLIRDRRDKIGFATPLGRYFDGALGDLVHSVLSSSRTAERGVVDPAQALSRLREHRAGGRTAGFELWRAFNLELWARYALDGEPVSSGVSPSMTAA
jgi:asparagine synthase (glutamine-hydrolysing)